MFHIELFRIRSFFGATVASLLASMGRGGLQFMLILWLQGIWLPLHGYSFSSTPLWAGIYLYPCRSDSSPAGRYRAACRTATDSGGSRRSGWWPRR